MTRTPHTATTQPAPRTPEEIARHYLSHARYDPDDDLRYQIEAIDHVFWLAHDAGIEHDTDYLDILTAQRNACRQVLAERARRGYRYQPSHGYDRDHLDDLKRRVPILDVLGNAIALRRQGKNYVGLCPFHDERTPSFTVFPATASYYCFGCQHYGDALDWLRRIAGMDFRGAVQTLEVLAGVAPAAPAKPRREQPEQSASPTTRGPEPHRQLSDASPFVYHNGKVRHG